MYLAVAGGPAGFQKLVVLKVLKQSLAEDCEFRTMMLGEARLAARLQHPNIVQTYEVIEDGSRPIIVMEFLDGQPLSSVIVRGRQGGFSLAMLLRVLCDALAGLHAAHEAVDFDGAPLGVVHRDVSPHNLFVTVQGQTKVLDFGIAKLHRSLVETEIGTIKGKLRYMAPEQIAGAPLDRRADIYAAGVILWEALAGERMWKGAAEDDIKKRVQAGDLPALPPAPASASAPAALARICRRALARLPGDRYPTALSMAEELEAALPALGPPVAAREIGALVAQLFADTRAETLRAVERTLAAGPADGAVTSPIDGAASRTRELGGPLDPVAAPDGAEAAGGAAAPAGAGVRSGPGRRGVGLIVLAVAAAAAVVVAAGRRTPPPPVPAKPDGERRAELPLSAAAPSLSAAPAAEGQPESVEAPRGVPPRPAGRGPKTPAPRHGRGGAVARSPVEPGETASPAGPPAQRPAPADCEYPFFVGPDGIKRFRPECM